MDDNKCTGGANNCECDTCMTLMYAYEDENEGSLEVDTSNWYDCGYEQGCPNALTS